MRKYLKLFAFTFSSLLFFAQNVFAAGATEHHEKSSGGLPQLDPTWFASQIFWLVITFVFLYIYFSRTVLPSLSSTLENRQDLIQSDLDTAQDLKNEAEEVQASYEKILEEARIKASNLHIEIEQSISEKSAKEYNEFQDRMMKELQLSEVRISKSTKEAMDDMTSIVAEIASDAAEKIVGVSTDIKKVKTVVEDLNSKAKAA